MKELVNVVKKLKLENTMAKVVICPLLAMEIHVEMVVLVQGRL